MKHRILALALCLCLALSLCACAPADNGGQPDPAPETSLEPSAEPLESAATEPSAGAEMPTDIPEDETTQPTDAPEGVGTQPIQTPSPSSGAPSAQPTAEPTLEPTKDFTAADLYAMWLTTSEQFPAPASSFIDLSAHVDAYYTTLNLDDVDSFVFYQPNASSSLQDVFIAKAKSGKASAVKSACQDRLEGLREEAEFYPGTSEYVDNAKLETAGDWVVLAACVDNARLVKIVKDAAK